MKENVQKKDIQAAIVSEARNFRGKSKEKRYSRSQCVQRLLRRICVEKKFSS